MEYKYSMNRNVFFVCGAGIVFSLMILFFSEGTRGDFVDSLMLNRVNSYSLIFAMILFVTYRSSSILFKFKKIVLLDQEMFFPTFTLYYSHHCVKYSEIKLIKMVEPLGGIVVATDSGRFVIKKRYFDKGKFQVFLSELESRAKLKICS